MTIQAQLADGRVLEFPDGTDPAVIQATVKKVIGVQQEQVPQEQESSFGDKALGALENVGSFASGMVAEPIAGIAGIAQSLNPFADEGAGAEAVKSTREALTYKPRTEAGKSQQQVIGETLAPVGEVLSGAEKYLGDNTLRITGSPALAAMAHTLPTAALELIGVKGSKKLASVKPPTSKLINKTLIEAAPDIEKVRAASKSVFKEIDNSGAVVKKEALSKLDKSLNALAKREGIREGVSVPVYNSINAIKKDIGRGVPIPINEITDLRSIAKNAVSTTEKNITRQALMVLDEVDSFIDELSPSDLARNGSVSAGEISKKLKSARALYGRAKRAEMLQDAITMGSSRKAGVEKGIRNELNNLINRKGSRKFLSSDDISAIRKVTDGDIKQNLPSMLGGMGIKFENSPSVFNSLIAGASGGGIAASLGMSGAAIPVAITAVTVGTVAKEVAKKITKNRSSFLKTMQLAGNDAQRITKAYLNAVPKAQRKISDLSDLLLDPNIDLSTLENIASETVKDAVKAAMFKRELMQAATATSIGKSAQSLKQDENDNESN